MLRALRDEPLTIGELISDTGKPRGLVYLSLRRLARQGQVEPTCDEATYLWRVKRAR